MDYPRVRRDVWTLQTEADPWDQTTSWYARAVAEMKRRSAADPADPTGWTYQGAIHGTAAAPGNGDQAKTWNQCQHFSWYFPPWHRMYLYYFERLIRSIVVSQGGPEDWALPYWNYSRGGDTAKLPPAFRMPQWTPDGTAEDNPLYVAERNTDGIVINDGEPLTKFDDPSRPEESVVAYQGIFNYANYAAPAGSSASFGGAVSAFAHFDGGNGELERQPHNIIHVVVGGSGWMSDPFTAALDPIFWLHHANIDRLWELWLADGSRHNPTEPDWRNQKFTLFDEHGAQTVISVAEVLDTVDDLGYSYDDRPSDQDTTRTPAAAAAAGWIGPTGAGEGDASARAESARAEQASARAGQVPTGGQAPQLVAASDRGIELTGASAAVGVPLDATVAATMSDVAAAARARGAAAEPGGSGATSRFYLSLEGLQASQAVGEAYRVYLKPTVDSDDEHFVGTLTFFGAQPHERRAEETAHPGTLAHTYDITDLVGRLDASGTWSRDQIAVVLRPVGASRSATARGAGDSHPPATIGRVSIFQH